MAIRNTTLPTKPVTEPAAGAPEGLASEPLPATTAVSAGSQVQGPLPKAPDNIFKKLASSIFATPDFFNLAEVEDPLGYEAHDLAALNSLDALIESPDKKLSSIEVRSLLKNLAV